MSANEVNPGPPNGDPGSPQTFKIDPSNQQQPGPPTGPEGNQLPAVQNPAGVQPGPPTGPSGNELPAVQVSPGPPNGDSGSPQTFKIDPPESQPGPPTGPGGNQLPAVQHPAGVQPGPPNSPGGAGHFRSVGGLKNEAEVVDRNVNPPDPSRMKNPREPQSRKVFMFGLFAILMCLLLGMAAIISGAFNPGGITADQPTQEVTSPPTEETTSTVPPEETEVVITGGFCGSACAVGAVSCAEGLSCSPITDPNIQGSSACLRNGHCGCGVPCDPNGGSVCDPGLTCVTKDGASTCWAGGCEATSTPTCAVTPGDGVCSACETVDSAPQDCSPPDTGNGSGGGGGGNCRCRCRTVCAGFACTRVCQDCNGRTCTP